MTNSFVFVSYTGNDAGEVLDRILKESEGEVIMQVQELESDTEVRQPIGFRPNPETGPEPEGEPDEPDDLKR